MLAFMHFAIFLGKRKRDDKYEPLCLTNEDGWKFLCTAVNVLKQWKSSGRAGLTKETFTACIQSIEAMSALAEYLLKSHGFQYVLPGKFSSDPIEGRSGWYWKLNGGNFFMSIKQLFEAEKNPFSQIA